jgi:hypothetical protein
VKHASNHRLLAKLVRTYLLAKLVQTHLLAELLHTHLRANSQPNVILVEVVVVILVEVVVFLKNHGFNVN